MMRSDLKWNSHVDSIIKKASKRLYFWDKTKKKIIPRKKLGKKIFPGIVQKIIPSLEDRPINLT
jgi:hypothetical protein